MNKDEQYFRNLLTVYKEKEYLLFFINVDKKDVCGIWERTKKSDQYRLRIFKWRGYLEL